MKLKIYGVADACYGLGLGSVLSQQSVLEPTTNTSKIRSRTNPSKNCFRTNALGPAKTIYSSVS